MTWSVAFASAVIKTDVEREYGAAYKQLTLLQRAGQDVDGNAETDATRRRLHELWLLMTYKERERWLSPKCLDRVAEGPVNRDYSSTETSWTAYNPKPIKGKLRTVERVKHQRKTKKRSRSRAARAET